MSNITVYKFLKKISTNLQTVAEKTAKNFGGYFFLPHPVCLSALEVVTTIRYANRCVLYLLYFSIVTTMRGRGASV